MPLTDLELRRSKPQEKPYTLSDGGGLSILIEPNGSKGWRFRYRFDGKPKMLSLGTYPTVSLTEARQKRDEAKSWWYRASTLAKPGSSRNELGKMLPAIPLRDSAGVVRQAA